ncbi:MAG: amidohydrolase family protein [Xanthomonadales bacterium]|nr:amidohydrolase family protein [Xanthomonadales bacterium]
MKLKTPLLTLLITSTFVLHAQADTIVLECQQLLDVEAGKLLTQQQVLVDENRIKAVGSKVEAPADARRIELETCLPGLMDMHVHLGGQSAPNSYIKRFQDNEADYALSSAYYAGITLRAGFTTVRNLGDAYNSSVALRNSINSGQTVGPRIFTSAQSIGTTGGHADPTNGFRHDLMGDPGPADGVINSPDDARKAVRQRYKDGADWIKVTATGGVLSLAKNGQNPQFTQEELNAIVAAATDYGMGVAAHAHGAEGLKRAVLAGVTSIEHGTYMDDEVIKLMKQKGTWFVPTITAGRFVAEKAEIDGYFPAVVRPKAAAIGPQIQGTFAKAYKAGVKIAFGTDMGVGPHGENAQEFAYMVEAGMPELEAIRSATLSSAEMLQQSDDLGSISAGKYADIIAVSGNPLQDINVLRNVDFVMKDGQVIPLD